MALVLLPDRQYTAPSAADAVAITPAGTAWANSAYVTLLAATPAACVLTGVTLFTTHGAGASVSYDAEVDIATGAAGAETVIATIRGYNRQLFTSGAIGPTFYYRLPIPIDNLATGVRVAARLRKNDTNATPWTVAITYLQKPLVSTSLLTTTAVQKVIPPAAVGVTVTAGAVWVSGSWATLRSATGAALVVTGIVIGAPSTAGECELDLGTGAAGSETVRTTLRLAGTNQAFPAQVMLPNPLEGLAAATRVAARLRHSTASATLVLSLMVLEV
jgi:hypothetical protein